MAALTNDQKADSDVVSFNHNYEGATCRSAVSAPCVSFIVSCIILLYSPLVLFQILHFLPSYVQHQCDHLLFFNVFHLCLTVSSPLVSVLFQF